MRRPPPLDLGCGAGSAVAVLCRRGFDAYGVDVDSGGRGSSAVFPDWKTGWAQVGPLAGRVHLVSPQGYRLPFPDEFFDFCFSDQDIVRPPRGSPRRIIKAMSPIRTSPGHSKSSPRVASVTTRGIARLPSS